MPKSVPDARVVIGGASGFIGRALVSSFESDGIRVVRLVRGAASGPDEVQWQAGDTLDPAVLAGARAVICLNGASVGALPWTAKKRRELHASRINPRHELARALNTLGADAPHLVHASSAAFYGTNPQGVQDESAGEGTGFGASLAALTERAASTASTTITHARLGVVLHPDSVLKPIIALTLAGIAGRLGTGTQSWAWISLDDAVAALRHVVEHRIDGPVNMTGPTRATANDITFAVARELSKPFWVPVPAFALRTVLGRDAAENLLLADAEVSPKALVESGFEFRYATAEAAIHDSIAPLRLDA